MRTRVGVWLALAILAIGVLSAGCGGSSPSRKLAGSGSLRFSMCMRASGVPNFPDVGRGGMRIEGSGQTISVNGVSVDASAFPAARQTCEKYMPHMDRTPAQTAQAAQARARGLEFARCMRSHGVPSFPDPRALSSSGGSQVVYLPGINPQSPAFQAGAKACGGGPKGP